jgi:hypothetical protein
VQNAKYRGAASEGELMSGLEIPSWDPQTALLIGAILLEAIVLYAGYGGLERILGPPLLRLIVGGDGSGQ